MRADPTGNSSVVRRAITAAWLARKIAAFIWMHPANEHRRVRSLLRAVTYQLRARLLHQRTVARLGQRSSIWADLHRTAASKVVYANPPDHNEMLTWQRLLRPGDLFIDVGANVGSYAVWAGELGAEVIALEPAADTFSLLEENIALNGYPIRPIRAAAGSACGTGRFTAGRDSANRLALDGGVQVVMVTIDSLVGDRVVAGMKVDVEGFEIEVLRGCENALAEQRFKLIQLEWNATSQSAVGSDRQPVVSLLARHGYDLYRPDDAGRLVPLEDMSYGPDVFARPVTRWVYR